MVSREVIDKFVDVASVVLISVAAVLTALCGYQASRWDGEQTRLYNIADASRLYAAEAGGRSAVNTSINVTLFLDYIDAVQHGDTEFAQFIYRRLGPNMRPVMDAWLATHPLKNPKAPSSPFVMREYTQRMQAASLQEEAVAKADFNAAQNAHRNADEFTLLTVVFATVSFLAGISTKLVFPRHAIIVAMGILALLYGLGRLAFLPVL
ncbi:MAG: hypothetical protein WBD74_00390 [Candidatus Aquilonibacter sp.]